MTERTTERSNEWFWAPEPEQVRQAVLIGVTWAYVAGLAAIVLIAVGAGVALAITGVIYLADYGSRSFDVGAVRSPVEIVFWIVVPIAAAASIWASAYASTTERSVPRAAAAVGTALILGLMMHLSGFSGAAMAMLAVGWSLAIPVDAPARWAARAVPAVLVAIILFPGWAGMSVPAGVITLLITPLAAGLFVWLSDVAYQGLAGLRRRSDPSMIGRSPTSIDD